MSDDKRYFIVFLRLLEDMKEPDDIEEGFSESEPEDMGKSHDFIN